MKKNWLLVQLLLLLYIGGLSAQESKIDGVKMAVRMADSEIKQFPDPWTVDFNPKPVWNYTQGLIAQSMVQLWKVTHQQNYYSYAEKYAIRFIDPTGSIMGYKPDEHNIDAVNSGKFLFDIYETTKDDRYQKALKFLRDRAPRSARRRACDRSGSRRCSSRSRCTAASPCGSRPVRHRSGAGRRSVAGSPD